MAKKIDFDFGFTAVGVDELEKTVGETFKEEITEIDKRYLDTLEQLNKVHEMIMPFLQNLKANPEKEYIFWPNRVEKINQFIHRLEVAFSKPDLSEEE
jgi:hypothetical protein